MILRIGDTFQDLIVTEVTDKFVFFGNKNYQKFQEAVDLEKLAVAFSVGNSSEMVEKMKYFLENKTAKQKVKDLAQSYIESGAGATDDILKYLAKSR